MANRRISELQEQAGLQLAEDDLLTVVNVSEPDPGLKNKKLTISGTKAYLNVHYLPRTGGTISGSTVIQNNLTVSGATTIAGLAVSDLLTVSGILVQNDATVSGTISGTNITGGAIEGSTVKAVTFTGTTINSVTGKFSTLLSGVTVTGTSALFTNATATISQVRQ